MTPLAANQPTGSGEERCQSHCLRRRALRRAPRRCSHRRRRARTLSPIPRVRVSCGRRGPCGQAADPGELLDVNVDGDRPFGPSDVASSNTRRAINRRLAGHVVGLRCNVNLGPPRSGSVSHPQPPRGPGYTSLLPPTPRSAHSDPCWNVVASRPVDRP